MDHRSSVIKAGIVGKSPRRSWFRDPPFPIWCAEASIELSAAQQTVMGHGAPPSGRRGASLLQKGLVSLVAHGHTIDLSISDNAEIHFEICN